MPRSVAGACKAISWRMYFIVAVDSGHHSNERRDQQRSNPCSFGEFGDEDDSQRNAGGQCSCSIDEHARSRVGSSSSLAVHHHACLREREREKGADSEQRNEPIGNTSEDDQEEPRQ